MAQTRAQRWAPYRRRAILDANATTWEFYQKSLSDTSGLYTFSLTRSTVATHIGSDGYIDEVASGAARYEHPAAGGACLGLLHEDAQDNLHTYSDDFDTGWTHNWVSQALDAGVTGMTGGSANKMTVTGTASAPYWFQAVTLSASLYYCVSIYVKKGDEDQVRLRQNKQDSTACGVTYTFSTDTVSDDGNTTARGRVLGPNGWVRVWFVMQNNATGGAGNTIFYIGNGGVQTVSEYVYAERSQIEAVPYADSPPTSWIPTDSTSETRALDVYRADGDADFSDLLAIIDDPYTLYLELDDQSAPSGTADQYFFTMGVNTTTLWVSVRRDSPTSTRWITDDGPTRQDLIVTHSAYPTGMFKMALNHEAGNALANVDGDTQSNASVAAVDTTGWNRFWFAYNGSADPPYRTIYRELRIYEKAHTAAELAALTS